MSDTTEQIQSLLRGELSAIETYQQALEKIDPGEGAQTVERILTQHRSAAKALEEYASLQGERPAQDSGPWGTFAKAVEGVAKLLGDANALRALREGEKHGLDEYEDALESKDLTPAVAERIRVDLLPRQREHIQTLERLIERA